MQLECSGFGVVPNMLIKAANQLQIKCSGFGVVPNMLMSAAKHAADEAGLKRALGPNYSMGAC